MNQLEVWIVATLVLALLIHFLCLWGLPRYVTWTKVRAAVARSGGYNRLVHANVHSAGEDFIVMDNPDVLYSSAAYDVSETPLRVRGVVPDAGNYWSLSLYAWNTDNFFVVNDQDVKSKIVDLMIVRTRDRHLQYPNHAVVVAPSARGVLLVRMIAKDRNDKTELARLAEFQRRMLLQPFR